MQLDEHRPFQEKTWTVERIGWCGFAVLVIAALLGLTGAGGPLARGSEANAAGSVQYPRIARWGAPETIEVTLAPAQREREIAFSPSFAEGFEVESVVPQPSSVAFSQGAHVLKYEDVDAAPAVVTVFINPRAPGPVGFDLTVDGDAPMALSTFVLP